MARAMKMIMVATFLVFSVSTADAIITSVDTAEVIDGVAFVAGSSDQEFKTPISWEGLTQSSLSKKGKFSFYAAVPSDCEGELSDGNETVLVALANCAPPPPAGALAPVPATGQTTSYDTNNPQRDDGALQKGVAWPNPRFTINVNAADDTGVGGGIPGDGICNGTEVCNGTVTDNLTNLIWLRNANCPNSTRYWQTALNDVAQLNTNGTMNGNNCGDTSNGGFNQIDWRLPNVRELQSLVDYGFLDPARSNVAGTGQAGFPDDPLVGVTNYLSRGYWSSTTFATKSDAAWIVNFDNGDNVIQGDKGDDAGRVLAVRGPN